eukprot:6815302-Lingulodinium_polyedra.AAC.1
MLHAVDRVELKLGGGALSLTFVSSHVARDYAGLFAERNAAGSGATGAGNAAGGAADNSEDAPM